MNSTCPSCNAAVQQQSENPFRPFCSERCKMIDLYHWLNEDYVIPGKPVESDSEEESQDQGQSNAPGANI